MKRKFVKGSKRLTLHELKNPFTGDSLAEIVEDYKNNEEALCCTSDLNKLNSIIDCICGIEGNPYRRKDGTIYYRRCRHQAHMKNSTIEKLNEKLTQLESELEQFKDFEKLIDFVEKVKISGFGPLAKYDFPVRFGYSRGVRPEKYVYLHAGTLQGAKELMRLYPHLNKKEYLNKMPVEKLPKELRQLESLHIENLLCIFKDRLSHLEN